MLLFLLAFPALAGACPLTEPEVQYDEKTFTVTFCTGGITGFAGATLRRKTDGMHFDLEAKPIAEGDEVVTLSQEVGPGFVDYVVASWARKDPCTEGRHGCTAYGYALQDEYETWPHHAYGGSTHDFAPLSEPRVQVLDAGGGADLARKIRELLPTRNLQIVDGGKAGNPRTEIEILYRAKWDRVEAWRIAGILKDANLGFHWTVRHWPDAPEAFVIAAGG